MMVLAVLFAALGAVSNAAGTAFQRKAASAVPGRTGLRLLLALVRRPAWAIGIAGVTGAAVFQALALLNGPMALVQPLFMLELPFALLIAMPLLHRRPNPAGWWAVSGVVAGLALLLASAAPHGGRQQAAMTRWIPVLVFTLGAIAVTVLLARSSSSALFRAAALATGAAIGNALAAAFMKSATGRLADAGLVAFLTTWQTYGCALSGIAALMFLENALQAGPLVASQPALTIGDAAVSLTLGVILFDESVRTGWWLLPEAIGAALILWGVVRLTRVVPHLKDITG
ncbi:DMT family transporter [Streptomyces shenzhenensis]|uniref:DMT family transporter n=1 Tax=Streptomyces TaxID=1883 RepID=UPI001F3BCC72|nr:DMT family transporter [Streptomyces shenzhenensis]